jgi:hypothetical protein
MDWWSEICPPGGAPSVQFGGSTGISTLVILMSWWCALLKDKPDEEHADCLRTLKDVNCVFVAAINDLKDRPTVPAPALLSPTTPPLTSEPRKRASSGEPSSRKRTRYEGA